MAVTADKPAPYTAPSAILEVIDRRRNRGLATPINADVLNRAGVSAGLIPRTIQALQTLDLIDEQGQPTPTFEGIRVAPEAEYKKRLEDWLKAAYADVFAYVDPSADDETRIRDAFRTYNPVGQQDRMVTLFMGLCAAAGLMPEKTPPHSRPAARSATPRPVAPPKGAKPRPSFLGSGTASPPPAIAGLIASLPSEGWTKAERDKFLKTFESVLDFAVPVITNPAKEED
jgi:hypothetical protein